METLDEKLDKIWKIKFFIDGEESTPGEVFDAFYGGLDDLIDLNWKLSRANVDRIKQVIGKEKEKEYFNKWRETLPDEGHAVGTYQDGSKTEFELSPRTGLERTFHDDPELQARRIRQPNMIPMQDQEDQGYVLRKAEIRNPESRIMKRAVSVYGDKADREAYQSLLQGSLDPEKTSGFLMIPEPHTVVGLEKAYEALDIPRFTPRHKFVHHDDETGSLYMIRSFLDSVEDRNTDLENFAEYIAGMHSLGLTDERDRNKKHYCKQKGEGSVVNIDPDFITHVGRYERKLDEDLNSFFDMVKSTPLNFMEMDREVFKQMRDDRLDVLGDNRNGFLYLLPSSNEEIKNHYDEPLYSG